MPATSTPQKTIAFFGGSFDPLHNGHIAVIKTILKEKDIDELLLMPTGQSWQKEKPLFTAQTRLNTLKKAIQNLQSKKPIILSDLEINTPQLTNTHDTLGVLQKQYPHTQFAIVIGLDQYEQFHTWKKWERLLENYPLLVINREGYSKENNALNHYKTKIRFIDMPAVNISSSQLKKIPRENWKNHVPRP